MARYTDEEAEEILRRAIDRHEAEKDGLATEDLVEAARELGIPPELVARAEIEVRETAGVEARRRERRKKERQQYVGRLATFGVVSAFLAVLDYLTGPGWWVQWPITIWGFVLLLGLLKLFHPASIEKRDNRAERRRRQKLERDARKRRRDEAKQHRRAAEVEFEAAVEKGVAALMSVAARGLSGLAADQARKSREFAEYVARQKREEARDSAGRPSEHRAPRARVGPEPEEGEPEEIEARRPTNRRSRNPR